MADPLVTVLRPEVYHGRGKRAPFFEGWYYKLVSADRRRRYAVIPGVFLGKRPEDTHAFVQVLDGTSGSATYHAYPPDAFRASDERLDLRIGPNRFTAHGLSLRIEDEQRSVMGDLEFRGLTPWPVSIASPGIMGWYAWVPFMETYHGVVSLDHGIRGRLTVDGETADLEGGRGYIEKDWGQSFPAAWVWFQSNHFAEQGTSLTASVAIIPWLVRSFRGFIIGFLHCGSLHRFATYTGARIERLAVSDTLVEWTVRGGGHRLEMLATRGDTGLLHGPSRDDMSPRVPESLRATVAVRLTALEGGRERELFAGTGEAAGLEVNGDLDALLRR